MTWYAAAGRSPELLPLDALSVHAFPDQHVAYPVDGLAAAAHVDHEPVHAVNQTLHRVREFALLAPPAGRRLAHRREIGERRIAPGERAEVRVVEEPRRVAPPEDQSVETPVAGLVQVSKDGADGHDADLLGHEERAPRIGAVEDEAAGRPLEADRVAHREAAQPLGADAAGRDVDRERDHALPRGGRGHAPGAHGLRPERHRDPLARLEGPLRGPGDAQVHLDDIMGGPADARDLGRALPRLLGHDASAPETWHDLGGDRLDLRPLLLDLDDGIHEEVAAAHLDEALELLGALGWSADDPVTLRQRGEVLGVTAAQEPDPRGLRRLVVRPHGDEGQMRGREPVQRAARLRGRRVDLLEALAEARGVDRVG